jgi:hypothetical protein
MSEETSTYMFGIYDLFPGQKLEGWPADKVFSTEMSDAGDRDKAGQGAEDPVVRSVIEQLDKDVVSAGDRGRLRQSNDAAEARAAQRGAERGVFDRITRRW